MEISREQPPGCPLGLASCPVLAQCWRLQEECQRLGELSQTDPLTGLFNRRHLMEALEREMERTRRTALPTCLIMMDLDHFKGLNDTFGHQCGDAVLRRVGSLLKENVRKLDIPCRYGGEEFTLILPGTRLPQAVRLAERLRSIMGQVWQDPSGQGGELTASFGVATYRGREAWTTEAFLQQADRWLFLAKARGRNNVCHPEGEPSAPEMGLTAAERRAFLTGETLTDKAGESYG